MHDLWLSMRLHLSKRWECGAPRSMWGAFPFVVLLGHGRAFGLFRKHSPPSAFLSCRILPLLSSSSSLKYYSFPRLLHNRVISSRSLYFHKTQIIYNKAITLPLKQPPRGEDAGRIKQILLSQNITLTY